jgi:hypothetical protein
LVASRRTVVVFARAHVDRRLSSIGPPTTIVAGWTSVGDPALVPAPGGGLRTFFPGIRTTAPQEPLFGLNTATAPPAGAPWQLTPASIATADFAYARTPAATLAPDGTPLEAWYSVGTTVVHRGLDPGSPDYEYPVGPATTSIRQNIVTDEATGRVFVAWCSFGAVNGMFVQEVNGATGAPAGPARMLPGSTTTDASGEHSSCNLDSVAARTPLAARAGGGIYVAEAAGYPTLSKVLVWRLAADGTVAQTIAVDTSTTSHSNVALAAGPDGRIWVGWTEGSGDTSRVVVRPSDTAGTGFGTPISTAAPPRTLQADALDLAPQAQAVDVLARFSTTTAVALWHTRLAAAAAGPPVLGRTVLGAAVSGTVLVRAAGTATFVPLTSRMSIPTGSELDSTRGRVRLVAARRGRGTQSADFYQGRFVIRQARTGLTTLTLSGSLRCSRRHTEAPGRRRRLWGSGKGTFQTIGHYAAATVRGTTWLTEDTCAGTLVRVRAGIVDVFDRVRARHFLLRPGQSRLVRP